MGTAPAAIEWRCSDRPVPYDEAVAEMEQRIAAIRARAMPELVWLLEHPPLYTAGTSARPEDLLDPRRLPVHKSGRGGQYTYHGPGQRIAYVMLDLERHGRDVRCHVWRLEEWMIRTLARFNVKGERRDGRIGVWIAGGLGFLITLGGIVLSFVPPGESENKVVFSIKLVSGTVIAVGLGLVLYYRGVRVKRLMSPQGASGGR